MMKMSVNHGTGVEELSYGSVSLDRSLKLLQRCLKYSGLVDVFSGNSTRKCHTSRIVRYGFTFLALLLPFLIGGLSLIHLVIEMREGKTPTQLLPLVLQSTLFFLTVLGLPVLPRRNQIYQLMEDWKMMEMQLRCFNHSKIKLTTKIGYTYFFLFTILSAVAYFGLSEMDSGTFKNILVRYSFIRDIFNVHLLFLICAISSVYSFLWNVSLTEIVPIYFFYHVGCALENLDQEWKAHLKSERFAQQIWDRYEGILRLVDRANELFGLSMAINDFMYFFLIWITASLCITHYTENSSLVYCILLFIFVFRVIFANVLLSKLHLSTEKLDRSITGELSKKWHSFLQEDRDLLLSFLNALRSGNMAVRPLNLYVIRPHNLLSSLSVVVTYIIVVLQYKE